MKLGKNYQQGFAIVPVIILVALVGLMVPTVKYVTDPENSFDTRSFARPIGVMVDGVGSVTSVLNQPKKEAKKESASDIAQRIQEKFNQKQAERKQKEKTEDKEETPASAQRYQGLADNWQEIEQEIEEREAKQEANEEQTSNQGSQDNPNQGQPSLADYLPLDDLKAIQETGVDVGEVDKQMKLSAEQRQISISPTDNNENDENVPPADGDLNPTQAQQEAKDEQSCQVANGYWNNSKCLGYGEVNSGFTWCPSGEGRGLSYAHWFEGSDCEPKNNRPNSQDSCTISQGYWSGGSCILPGETSQSGGKSFVWCQGMEGEGHYPYPHWFEGDNCGVIEEVEQPVVVPETPVVEEIIELDVEPPVEDEACISASFCSSLGGSASGNCGCGSGEICCNLGTENVEDYLCNPGQTKVNGSVNLICDQGRIWINNPLPIVTCHGDECIPSVVEEATLVEEETTDAVCAPAMVCSVEGGEVVSVKDCPGSQVKCNFPESQVDYIGKPISQGGEIIPQIEDPFSVEDLRGTGKTQGEFCFTSNQCGGGLECNLFQFNIPEIITTTGVNNDLLMNAAVGPGGITLTENYVPEDLVSLGNAVPNAFHNAWHDPEIREDAVEYIQDWADAIYKELGAVPYFTYGYRSYELQDELHQGNPNGAYEAGDSQHQNGLAFDVPQFVTTENGQLVWHKTCTTRGRKECEVAVRAIEIAQEYGIAHPLDWDGPHFFVAAAISDTLTEYVQSIEDPVSTSYYIELNEEIIKLQNDGEQASEANMKGN